MASSETFISCDWGSSSFRLRHVRATPPGILGEFSSTQGVREFSGLPADDRRRACEQYFGDAMAHLATRSFWKGATPTVLVSGMASSSAGWVELPYARAPFSLDGDGIITKTMKWRDTTVVLVSGVRTATDVMRGEETELIGLFQANPEMAVWRDGVVILPGTHAKHARIRDGVLIDFVTYMTGELRDVLSRHTLLRLCTNTPGSGLSIDFDAFDAGVRAARDGGLGRNLFRTRSRSLLEETSKESNGWFLSGVLIGSELMDLLAPSPPPAILLGDGGNRPAYRRALQELGLGERMEAIGAGPTAVSPLPASVAGHAVLSARLRRAKTLSLGS